MEQNNSNNDSEKKNKYSGKKLSKRNSSVMTVENQDILQILGSNNSNSDLINNYSSSLGLAVEKNKAHDIFDSILSRKHKFRIDNHFDKKHCQKFLEAKEKCLKEMHMDDTIPEPEPENNNYNNDISNEYCFTKESITSFTFRSLTDKKDIK